jgi:hypothetical protein
MEYEEEVSDLVYLGRRLDNALTYIKTNEPDLIKMFYSNVEIPFIDILDGNLNIEREDYLFDYIDGLLDDLEETFGEIFENKTK